jgi:hypothetical protein
MLYGDARDRWDGGGVTDPRVRHFWDEQKTVGNWFSANVTHNLGTTWDFYALYKPDATGLTSPASSGGPIISQTTRLRMSIGPLLAVFPHS